MNPQTLLLSILILLTVQMSTAKGPGEPGGANICTKSDGQQVLLDLANIPQAKLDSSLDAPATPFQVDETQLFTRLGIDEVPSFKDHFRPGITSLAARLKKVSPAIENLFLAGFEGLTVYMINYEINKSAGADFKDSMSCDAANTKAIILYYDERLLITPQWNKVASLTQFAAVVHEIYRQIQVRYSWGQNDRDLQVATALTLTGNYSDLRNAEFFKKVIDKAEHTKIANIRTELCQKKFRTCSKIQASLELSETIERFCKFKSEDDLSSMMDSARRTLLEIMSYRGYRLLEKVSQSEKDQCSMVAVDAEWLSLALENGELQHLADAANNGMPHIINATMGIRNVTWQAMLQAAKQVPFTLNEIREKFRIHFEPDVASGLLLPN